MDSHLQTKVENLPQKPGVYLMKDKQGEIVYVGKAVNLRSRVRSYFNRSSDQRAFVGLLERILGDLDTVVVSTEKEALLLENELIKKHRPRFNVRLRDDKNFICLRLDTSHTYPRLEVVRRFAQDGALYFGPYASASSIRETVRTINRYFQLRTCSDHVLQNRKRPCLLHQIGRCPAPCVFEIPKEEYHRNVSEAALFLRGKADELVDALKVRIKHLSSELKFEEAAKARDQLWAIERSLEKQKIASTESIDLDAWGLRREADRLLFYVLHLRNGRLAGGQSHLSNGQEFPDEELLASFLNLFYSAGNPVPEEILLPFEVDGAEVLGELLAELRGGPVRVFVPKRGEKYDLLRLAKTNAEEALLERKRSREETHAILQRLKDRLHLSRVPYRMECFDISHFQGAGLVASMVSFLDGEPEKSRYRHFKLKTVVGNDDFASMYEIVSRRLKRGREEKDLPDLMIIDGGKGQLASAVAAMKDLGMEGLDVVGLAKSRVLEGTHEEQKILRSPERVFLQGRKDPIVLPQHSPDLLLLTRLRDEAHRFAVTFQQQQLRKSSLKSALEFVPGVGKARQKALLRHFGSFKKMMEASLEEIMVVEGMGAAVAERIHAFLHSQENDIEEMDTVRESSLQDAQMQAPGSNSLPTAQK